MIAITCFILQIGLLFFLYGWVPVVCGTMPAFILFAYLPYLFTKLFTGVDKTLMQQGDKRMAVVKEVVHGVRQIKLASMEDRWQALIVALRDKEVSTIKKAYYIGACFTFVTTGLPFFLNVVSNGVYYWIHGTLSPSVAFGESRRRQKEENANNVRQSEWLQCRALSITIYPYP